MLASPRRDLFSRFVALLVVGLMLMVGATVVPAGAQQEDIKPASSLESTRLGDIVEGPGYLPDCNSRNIDGTAGEATWTVKSTLGNGSVIYPGREWTITATMTGEIHNGIGNQFTGNNGPDPLYVALQPSGPVEPAAPTTGDMGSYGSNGPVGPGPTPWSYVYDANTNPGPAEPSDWLPPLSLKVHYRATAPGVIMLQGLHVDGVDGSPKDADGQFQCTMLTNWSWTVVSHDLPTSGADVAYTDASYAMANLEDRSGGAHGVRINVLANDNDPNVAGGPGDTDEVRIKDWKAASDLGGTVSCGTPAQKNETTFADMSTGPCTYTPAKGVDDVDSFIYVLASVSGLSRQIKVSVHPLKNTAPFASDTIHGGFVNTPEKFQLNPVDPQNDPVICLPEQHAPDPGGDIFVNADCTADWEPDPGFTGTADFTFTACDQNTTINNAQMGQNASRAPGYHEGSPDDLSATTSQLCSTIPAKINVAAGGVIPPVGVADFGFVDANYPGPSAGPFSLEFPVLDNDYDNNGPDPAANGSGVDVQVLDEPPANKGTATVLPNRRIRFTPASGVTGLVGFTYRLCEDPLQQMPPYLDNPNTPVNEGLAYCGVGKVMVFVLANKAPEAEPDQKLTLRDTPITDFDVSANDTDPEGTELVCTPGALGTKNPELIASATIDANCLVDVTPVAGATGVGIVDYSVCDSHVLTDVTYAADPYGPNNKQPGDPAPRCASSTLQVNVIAPLIAVPVTDPLPNCAPDVADTNIDTPEHVQVLSNDSDLNINKQASPLKVVSVSSGDNEDQSAKGGSAKAANNGAYVLYIPPAGFSGVDTFSYTALDTIGQICKTDVTITVAGLYGGDKPANPNPAADPAGGGTGGTGTGTDVNPTSVGQNGGTSGGTLPRTGITLLFQVGAALALLGAGGTITTLARRRNR